MKPFTVYRSSAGSGKTFTLVKEYLKILLENPNDFRHILAITFTNKAANEMKERTLKALKELSVADQSDDPVSGAPLLPMLMQESGLGQTEIAAKSRQALEMILHHYSDFAIGTIDSFSNKLIRTFAHDFRLPVNFNVELETDELLSTAVELLLERVGEDKELTNLLVGFIESRLEEEKGWNIAEILSSFAKNLLNEEGQIRIDSLRKVSIQRFHNISSELTHQIRNFERQIREIADQASSLIKNRNIPVAAFYQADKGVAKYFINLSAGRFDKLEPNIYVVKTVDEDKWFSGKATLSDKEDISAIKPELIIKYDQIQKISEKQSPDYRLRKLLAKTIYPLAVLHEIEKVLTEFKQQNNLIHISEFNTRIAAIVMNEPVPFIYERLGEKYHHLLIDEFQDTSALQWMNFIPLIENALAGGYFNLVVGDGKQAIYRWRGGDIEQFNSLPLIAGSDLNPVLKQREQSLKNHFHKVNLDKNFRSRAEIVEFNNRFFRIIANQALTGGKEKIFNEVEQQYDKQNTGGYISLEFLSKDDDGLTYEATTLNRILEIIHDATGSKFSLKDIAILCRSNYNATRIAGFLLANGVDVVSAESLLIRNSLKIRFIISFLRLLYEPPNEIVREEVRLYLQSRQHNELDQPGKVFENLTVLPIYDLCETIIRRFDLSQSADPYLQFFLDVVLKFSAKTSYNAIDFLEFWEKNSARFSITVPEELDAVKVMTIHKAKGLQFPIVILPFAQEYRKNTKTYLWVELDESVAPGLETAILRSDKDMEATVYKDLYQDEQEKSMLDLLNILYVAMTRPEERLFILTSLPPAQSEAVDSLPKFFGYFLKAEGLFAEEQRQYEFGTLTDHSEANQKEKPEALVLNEFISSDWQKKINIRTSAPHSWDADNPLRNADFGNRIHKILSWIKTADDISTAIERAEITGLIESTDVERISKTLLSVIHHPDLADCFLKQAKIKTEPEILLPHGIFYRPDRVVIIQNAVIIIDYKTGSQRPEHALQLNQYAGYIAEMGYNNIKCLLVYLEPEVKVIAL